MPRGWIVSVFWRRLLFYFIPYKVVATHRDQYVKNKAMGSKWVGHGERYRNGQSFSRRH